ncbi:MAG: hypothetical protein ACLUDH_00705 [Faecalispora sporosphaeroides]|uniref:hypothetical protein n=1 Tax=Faecalispora sporosphaeroides TaxID=1549 RepID=UPI003993B73D
MAVILVHRYISLLYHLLPCLVQQTGRMFCFFNDSGLHFPDRPAVRMPRPVGHARASGISRGGALTEKWQKKQIKMLWLEKQALRRQHSPSAKLKKLNATMWLLYHRRCKNVHKIARFPSKEPMLRVVLDFIAKFLYNNMEREAAAGLRPLGG